MHVQQEDILEYRSLFRALNFLPFLFFTIHQKKIEIPTSLWPATINISYRPLFGHFILKNEAAKSSKYCQTSPPLQNITTFLLPAPVLQAGINKCWLSVPITQKFYSPDFNLYGTVIGNLNTCTKGLLTRINTGIMF